jgi:hypothetical protein
MLHMESQGHSTPLRPPQIAGGTAPWGPEMLVWQGNVYRQLDTLHRELRQLQAYRRTQYGRWILLSTALYHLCLGLAITYEPTVLQMPLLRGLGIVGPVQQRICLLFLLSSLALGGLLCVPFRPGLWNALALLLPLGLHWWTGVAILLALGHSAEGMQGYPTVWESLVRYTPPLLLSLFYTVVFGERSGISRMRWP